MATWRTIAMVAAVSMLPIAAVSTPALAHGRRGAQLFILARAAGITHQQIAAAFKGDANLKTDRANLKNARQALVSCLVSGGNCTSQISAYTAAQQTLTQEQFSVWQGLFQKAPNLKQAASVLGQLNQLETQRHNIFTQVFGGASGMTPGE